MVAFLSLTVPSLFGATLTISGCFKLIFCSFSAVLCFTMKQQQWTGHDLGLFYYSECSKRSRKSEGRHFLWG